MRVDRCLCVSIGITLLLAGCGPTSLDRRTEAGTDAVPLERASVGSSSATVAIGSAAASSAAATFVSPRSSVRFTLPSSHATAQVSVSSTETGWQCGDVLKNADGQTYPTISIGSQCWMARNMNAGTFVVSGLNQRTDCNDVQKYCYDNDVRNCELYGGLYQWHQAMCGSEAEGGRGLCPRGWRMPSHDDWTMLERSLCLSSTCASDFPFDDETRGWRGTMEGLRVQDVQGFGAQLGGYSDQKGLFGYMHEFGNYWTSTTTQSGVLFRDVGRSKELIGRHVEDALLGFSVRCIKNNALK